MSQSSRWKSQSGLHRQSTNNIVRNNSTFGTTMINTPSLGSKYTTIDTVSDIRTTETSNIYNFDPDSMNYSNIICYYPFNDLSYSTGTTLPADTTNTDISNQSLASNLFEPYPNTPYSLIISEVVPTGTNIPQVNYNSIINQNVLQLNISSNVLITDTSFNTINTFGTCTCSSIISSALTMSSFIYIPSGQGQTDKRFCLFALDDINQTGLTNYTNTTTDSSDNIFYLWYPNKNGNVQMLYNYKSEFETISSNLSVENTTFNLPYDTWTQVMVVFSGIDINVYVNGNMILSSGTSISGVTYIPDTKLSINLGPKYYDIGSELVTGNSSTNAIQVQLSDYKISNTALSSELIFALANQEEGYGHKYSIVDIEPNREGQMYYLLSRQICSFTAPSYFKGELNIGGDLQSYGTNSFYGTNNFYTKPHFYDGFIADSSSILIYQTEVGNLSIESITPQTTQQTASLIISNAGGLDPLNTGFSFMPSMLVYNSAVDKSDLPTTTDGLIFSISGENVSVGSIFGDSSFNVLGNAVIDGNLGIRTNDPLATLDINGDISLNGVIDFSDNIFIISRDPLGSVAIGYDAGSISQQNNSIAIGTDAGNLSQNTQSVAIGYKAGFQNQLSYSVAIGTDSGKINQKTQSVAIGNEAGTNNQFTQSVAIGYQAGFESQNTQSVAIGSVAGLTNQSNNSVAIGNHAGRLYQNQYSVAIGNEAGSNTQNQYSVAIGYQAGKDTQGPNSVAIGTNAGDISQNQYSVAIGFNAGYTGQNQYSVAIGRQAGQTSQGSQSVAIGSNAGYTGQNQYSIAIGRQAGEVTQSDKSVAIGFYAGQTNQQNNSVAIGNQAGANSQQLHSVAIGNEAGNNTQNTNSVAIGTQAGSNNQNTQSVAIGSNAGKEYQQNNSVAIGSNAGNDNQQSYSVAIGSNAGYTQSNSSVAIGQNAGISQNSYSVAIGSRAGETIQGAESVAIGSNAGASQGAGSIAIGRLAGNTGNTPSNYSVAIGYYAGQTNQLSYSVAIGTNAGNTGQGTDSVAIGTNAGQTDQGTDSVAIGSNADCIGENSVAIGVDTSCNSNSSVVLGTGAQSTADNQITLGTISETVHIPGQLIIDLSATCITPSSNMEIANKQYVDNHSGNLNYTGYWSGDGTTLTVDSEYTTVEVTDLSVNTHASIYDLSVVNLATFGTSTTIIDTNHIQATSGDFIDLSVTNHASIYDLSVNGMITGNCHAPVSDMGIANKQYVTNSINGHPGTNYWSGDGTTSTLTVDPEYTTVEVIDLSVNTHASIYDLNVSNIIDFSDKIFISSINSASSVAIGTLAGQTNQGSQSVAIGFNAGYTGQNQYSVAIGTNAGYTGQSTNSVAIGSNAGYTGQNQYSIAIGRQAGQTNQSDKSVAIGNQAGTNNQQNNSVAIGNQAGQTSQNEYSVAIGQSAGKTSQLSKSVAIGNHAGTNNQQLHSVAIGNEAGNNTQGTQSVAIGTNAGKTSQKEYSVAVGYHAGREYQQNNSIAIGREAGYTGQSANSVAIGQSAGKTNQGEFSVAIGSNADCIGENSVAIGVDTSCNSNSSVVLGTGAQSTANNQITLGTISETVRIPGTLDVSGNISIKNELIGDGNNYQGGQLIFDDTHNVSGPNKIQLHSDGYGFGIDNNTLKYLSGSSSFGTHKFYSGSTLDSDGTLVMSIDSTGITVDGNIYGTCHDPSSNMEIANKQYVDNSISGHPGTNYWSGDGTTSTLTVDPAYTTVEVIDLSVNTHASIYDLSVNGMITGTCHDPSSNMEIANKQYVTNSINGHPGTNYWSGDGTTSTLTVDPAYTTVEVIDLSVNTHASIYDLSVNGMITGTCHDPSSNMEIANKQYVTNSINGHPGTNYWSGDGTTSTLTVDPAYTTVEVIDLSVNTHASIYDLSVNGMITGTCHDPSSNMEIANKQYVTNSINNHPGNTNYWSGDGTTLTVAPSYTTVEVYDLSVNNYASVYGLKFSDKIFISSINSASSVAIGYDAGLNGQNEYSIAIGYQAGKGTVMSQGANCVAIGREAGEKSQGTDSVAIGNNAGYSTGSKSVAIGYFAGRNSQSANSVAIGYNAGRHQQFTNSVAIGREAGETDQGENSVAIGYGAGQGSVITVEGQGKNSVAIGYQAGKTEQGEFSVALGSQAGSQDQSANSIAIGQQAGYNQNYQSVAIGQQAGYNQNYQSVAIGFQAGKDYQNHHSIAIGYQAGKTEQGEFSVALGNNAGLNNQGTYSVAIGSNSGGINQGGSSVAIGGAAGNQDQSANCVAIGYHAGDISQNQYSVAIGCYAGQTNQSNNSIAIGYAAGIISQNQYSVAIGNGAGYTGQSEKSVAIGLNAGAISQYDDSVAIGHNAGYTGQLTNSVAIGHNAGYTQANNSVAIGLSAGNDTQEQYSVAIGNQAGQTRQGEFSVAIGHNAGYTGQLTNSVAIGNHAGYMNQGDNSVAIGYNAGGGTQTNQGDNSVAIGPNTICNNSSSVVIGTGATSTDNNQITLGTISETVRIPGTLDVSGNISIKNAIIGNNFGNGQQGGQLIFDDTYNIGGPNKIQLHSAGYGFGIDTATLKYLSGSGGTHKFYIDSSVKIMSIDSTGIDVTGTVTADSFNATSDIRLKENITDLDNSLEKICNIRGVNYNWINDETKTKTAGVIAQEVLEHIPESINDNNSEKLSVNYNSIIAHLIESVKTLKREIDELKANK